MGLHHIEEIGRKRKVGCLLFGCGVGGEGGGGGGVSHIIPEKQKVQALCQSGKKKM